MKTQIIISFEPKAFETASDLMGELLLQFTAFVKKRYIDLFYQMTLPCVGMVASWSCPVEAPAKEQPQNVIMPVEMEDGDLLLTTNHTR